MDNKKDLNGQELHRLKLELGLEEGFAKEASTAELEEIDSLQASSFANPASKELPCHTKEATTRSIVYFFGRDYDSPYPKKETEERLYKAARFFKVADEFYTTKSAFMNQGEEAVEGLEYALGNKLPISTVTQITKSAAVLAKSTDKINYSRRSEAAACILKAAAEHDMDLGALKNIQIMSGAILKESAEISKSLFKRASAFNRLGLGSNIYKEAAKSIKENGCNVETADDLCSALEQFEHFDKVAAMAQNLEPIESMFFTTKEQDLSVSLANGSSVLMSQVKKASLSPFYALGATVPLEVTDGSGQLDVVKAAKYLECIPKVDCNLFEEVLKQCLK